LTSSFPEGRLYTKIGHASDGAARMLAIGRNHHCIVPNAPKVCKGKTPFAPCSPWRSEGAFLAASVFGCGVASQRSQFLDKTASNGRDLNAERKTG